QQFPRVSPHEDHDVAGADPSCPEDVGILGGVAQNSRRGDGLLASALTDQHDARMVGIAPGPVFDRLDQRAPVPAARHGRAFTMQLVICSIVFMLATVRSVSSRYTPNATSTNTPTWAREKESMSPPVMSGS